MIRLPTGVKRRARIVVRGMGEVETVTVTVIGHLRGLPAI
jgi:hypothetical protein